MNGEDEVTCRRCGVERERDSGLMHKIGSAYYCYCCKGWKLEQHAKRARMQAARKLAKQA